MLSRSYSLYNLVYNLCYSYIYNPVYRRCRPKEYENKINALCKEGNLKVVIEALPYIDKNRILLTAVSANKNYIVEYLLTQITYSQKVLNSNLKEAVKNGFIEVSETLLKKDANPLFAIPLTDSKNMLELLSRYRKDSSVFFN